MSTTTTRGCPECDGRLRTDGTETVCEECGLIVGEDALDRGPEWRSFADDARTPERCGAPLTRSRHDRGLSTEIGYSTRLKGRKRRRVARLRYMHNRTKMGSKADRNLAYGFGEIRRLTGQLELPNTLNERACVLFKSAQDEGLLLGRSIEGFAAATVYAVCRSESVSRTLEEITAISSADENQFKVAYNTLNRELRLAIGPIDPAEYLARFASKLGAPRRIERRARELAEFSTDSGLAVGRNPSGIAAGCLYAAAQELDFELTQAEVADVADVCTLTVRKNFRALTE